MGLKAGVIFSPSYFMHHLSKEEEKTFSYFSFEKLLSNILFCKKKLQIQNYLNLFLPLLNVSPWMHKNIVQKHYY